jgi:hypothetical protein
MGRWAIINGLLAIMVALLGLEIVRTWGRELPAVEVAARPPAPEPPREKGGKRGGEKGGAGRTPQATPVLVEAIGEKDLFDPSRRPPAEDAAPAAPPPVTGPPTNLTVAGVRISGRNREAFVTDSSQGNRQQRLHIGDQVAAVVAGQAGTVNYTIKAIDPTGLTLASPSGETITMPLELDRSKAPAAPKTPTPPRPGQPAPAAPVSPAAGGMLGAAASPAAGRQPAPPPPVPGQQPPPQIPPEVRQRLERINQPGTERPGRKQQ